MKKWINQVEVNCDPTREGEYKEWFLNVHLPDVLATPGFVRATQLEMKTFRDGRGKYLHVYDIETDDIDQTMKNRLERRDEEKKRGRYRNQLTIHVWRDVLWKRIAERAAPEYKNTGLQKWVNLVEVNCDPLRADEFIDWYVNVHMPDVVATPGFVGARQHEMKEFRDGRGKYHHFYNIETDDIDKTMKTRLERREEEKKRGRYRNGLTIPVWRDVVWKQIAERVASPKSEAINHLPW